MRLFVDEILRGNHPIETFIDPDFTYLNAGNAAEAVKFCGGLYVQRRAAMSTKAGQGPVNAAPADDLAIALCMRAGNLNHRSAGQGAKVFRKT